MALSDTVFDFQDASIRFFDNTPVTPLELNLVHTTGDTAESGGHALGGGNRALSIYQTRGGSNATRGNTTTRPGAHEPSSLALTLQIFDYIEATVGTIRDWEYRTGPFSAAISFEDDPSVFSFGIEITFNRPDAASAQMLAYGRCIIATGEYSEGEPNTASMSIQMLGTAVASIVP